MDSLTSGFNIAKNNFTDDRFNEIFDFTDDEIQPILDALGEKMSREEIQAYYDGYRFSPHADRTVYNSDMVSDLLEGKIDRLIELTETMLNGLSNRDYERFDEKYIKVVMLSMLSDVNIYIPHSEYETGADGYVDLYLQAAFEPDRSAHYFIELKYAKASATEKTLERKEQDGRDAMARYLRGPGRSPPSRLRPGFPKRPLRQVHPMRRAPRVKPEREGV